MPLASRIFLILFVSIYPVLVFAKDSVKVNDLVPGMSAAQVFERYPRDKARTSRGEADEEWLTFDLDATTSNDLLTVHLKADQLVAVSINDRAEVVAEYCGEFCSQAFLSDLPKMHAAITGSLEKVPQEVFVAVTDRARPVLFTEYYNKGFANSAEITSGPQDPPTMQQGLTLIKLNTDLEAADSVEQIEGVILHELAHRYLEHYKRRPTCKLEKEANRQVKAWGFGKEFEAAKEKFGSKAEGANTYCNEDEVSPPSPSP